MKTLEFVIGVNILGESGPPTSRAFAGGGEGKRLSNQSYPTDHSSTYISTSADEKYFTVSLSAIPPGSGEMKRGKYAKKVITQERGWE